MKRKCFITGEELDIRYMRKTYDNFWVKTEIYIKTVEELKKGVVNSNDIRKVLTLLKQYHVLLLKLLLVARKVAKIECISLVDVLDDLLEEEQEWSIKNYKKYYKCLTRKEHIKFMNYILNTERYLEVDTPSIIDTINYDDTMCRKYYLNGRCFTNDN